MTKAQSPVLRVALATIAVIAIAVSAYFLWLVRSTFLLLGVGILFGGVLEPQVNRIRRIGFSRSQALLLLYLVIFAVLGVVLYFTVPILARQVGAFDRAIPGIFDDLQQRALNSRNDIIRQSGYRALAQLENGWTRFRTNPNLNPDQAFSVVNALFGISWAIISTLIVTFYWTVEKVSIKRSVLGLFPFGTRGRAHTVWDDIEYRIGGWARGQLILMVVMGVLCGAMYRGFGLRFWLALGIIAGLMEVVPYLGPIIAGGAAALVALTDSPQKAVLVLFGMWLMQQLEGAFLVPRIMKHSVGLTPLTIVLAVLIGNTLGGPAGSIVAIPIGAAVQVILSSIIRSRDESIAMELRSMDIRPIAPGSFDTPFMDSGYRPLPDTPTRKRRLR